MFNIPWLELLTHKDWTFIYVSCDSSLQQHWRKRPLGRHQHCHGCALTRLFFPLCFLKKILKIYWREGGRELPPYFCSGFSELACYALVACHCYSLLPLLRWRKIKGELLECLIWHSRSWVMQEIPSNSTSRRLLEKPNFQEFVDAL